MRRKLAALSALPLSLVLLVGCGDGRKCLRGHTSWIMIPVTHCYPSGTTTRCSTTLQLMPVYQCDEYAPKAKDE